MPENKNFSRRSKKETGKKSLEIPKIRPKKQKKLENIFSAPLCVTHTLAMHLLSVTHIFHFFYKTNEQYYQTTIADIFLTM